ncbi:MAG: sulfite exporter TauE/SafE family protein [Rhodovulum sulfidophilum]|uniref:Probable membrane transporter protein n=1 Tax=Rhodovulum sulfidophilum TaxID=35806 RepID=A0A2W5N3S8_RHOSU|nr:MAG: sulfite exporter TauE/SafE family protein [Rhodovulum sulfidophilum]
MSDILSAADANHWLIAGVVVFLGSCLQGLSGVGLGMVAAPLLLLLLPQLVPGPLLFISCLLSVLAVRRERADVDTRGLGYALTGRFLTSVLAAWTIGFLPVREMSIVFALVILGAVALSLTPVRLSPTRPALFVAGLVSGFMGTLTSVGMPPMALVYQNESPARIRASLSGFLAVGALISIIALAAVSRFGARDILFGLFLMLPMWLGYRASTPLAHRVPRETLRVLVVGLSGLAGALLLLRQF